MCGQFTSVSATARNFSAAVNTAGNLLSWNPNAQGDVVAIAISGDNVYIGGTFEFVGATSRIGIAAINTAGTLLSWDANVQGSVFGIGISGPNVYFGGAFNEVLGQFRPSAAAVNTAGSLLSWQIPDIGYPHTFAFIGSNIYMVTSQNRAIAYTDAGVALDWGSQFGTSARTLSTLGENVYVGGDFTRVTGVNPANLAGADTSGAPLFGDRNVSGSVRSITVAGAKVLITGEFNSVAGASRSKYAELSTSGDLLSTELNAVNIGPTVFSVIVTERSVYIPNQGSESPLGIGISKENGQKLNK